MHFPDQRQFLLLERNEIGELAFARQIVALESVLTSTSSAQPSLQCLKKKNPRSELLLSNQKRSQLRRKSRMARLQLRMPSTSLNVPGSTKIPVRGMEPSLFYDIWLILRADEQGKVHKKDLLWGARSLHTLAAFTPFIAPLQTADPYCLDSSDAFKEGEMSYVQCPAEYDGQRPTLFLAGGISNCADWQVPLRDLVHSMCPGLVPVNPRRENFDVSKPEMTEEQIKWEFKQLRKAAAIVFWFPRETLCPITLYELGTWSVLHKMHGCDIFVGTDPEYARKEDVKIQLCLATDTDFPVVHSIEELAQQLQGWWKDHTSVAN